MSRSSQADRLRLRGSTQDHHQSLIAVRRVEKGAIIALKFMMSFAIAEQRLVVGAELAIAIAR
ncbi:hypothetical protein A0U87_07545 [Sphingobium sp. MP9-4]|nr:hypothetical protein A0U87_07545 [Sphingobium sp. MP9-4]